MKAEVIETRSMSRFLGIGSVQDRQVDFAVRKMNRTVLGAVHLIHVEHLLVEISQLVRLVGENREMTEFGHCLSSLAVLQLRITAITGSFCCQRAALFYEMARLC